mgnify:CR=1 FL=1
MGVLTKEHIEKFNLDGKYDIFFETGTFNGDTISNLLNTYNVFDEYHSVEIDPTRFNNCSNKFKNNQQVQLYYGDSADILQTYLGNDIYKDKRILFWLDAHWMGDTATQGDTHCPLIKELEAMKQLNIKPTIIIDDMFYMLNRDDKLYYNPEKASRLNKAEHWPELDNIKSVLNSINPEYNISLSLIPGVCDFLIAK